MKSTIRARRVLAGAMAAAAVATPVAHAAPSTVAYDTFNKPGYSLDDYAAKWANPYGPLEMANADTRSFAGKRFSVSAVPFTQSADFSVFDHLKYIGVSTTAFPVPDGLTAGRGGRGLSRPDCWCRASPGSPPSWAPRR